MFVISGTKMKSNGIALARTIAMIQKPTKIGTILIRNKKMIREIARMALQKPFMTDLKEEGKRISTSCPGSTWRPH